MCVGVCVEASKRTTSNICMSSKFPPKFILLALHKDSDFVLKVCFMRSFENVNSSPCQARHHTRILFCFVLPLPQHHNLSSE